MLGAAHDYPRFYFLCAQEGNVGGLATLNPSFCYPYPVPNAQYTPRGEEVWDALQGKRGDTMVQKSVTIGKAEPKVS